jgi:head-tail adaptor
MPFSNCTLTIRHVTTTTDELGDGTTSTSESTTAWALIAPRSSTERADPRAPAVITAATIYAPFGEPLDADDRLVVSGHGGMDGEWQVEGDPGHWSLGDWKAGLEVAVKRV